MANGLDKIDPLQIMLRKRLKKPSPVGMSEAMQKIFSEISPSYDRLNHFMSLNTDRRWREKTIKLLPYNPDKSFTLLDMCCGTADLSLTAVKRFPHASIAAVDFSRPMLEIAAKKIKPYSQIKPCLADALHLPFEDNHFDAIVCGFGVRNLDSLPNGVKEMHRVLKQQGHLIVLEFFKPANFMGKVFHRTYARHIMPLWGRMLAHHAEAYEYLSASIAGFVTAADFKDLLEKNGFCDFKSINFFMSVATAIRVTKGVA